MQDENDLLNPAVGLVSWCPHCRMVRALNRLRMMCAVCGWRINRGTNDPLVAKAWEMEGEIRNRPKDQQPWILYCYACQKSLEGETRHRSQLGATLVITCGDCAAQLVPISSAPEPPDVLVTTYESEHVRCPGGCGTLLMRTNTDRDYSYAECALPSCPQYRRPYRYKHRQVELEPVNRAPAPEAALDPDHHRRVRIRHFTAQNIEASASLVRVPALRGGVVYDGQFSIGRDLMAVFPGGRIEIEAWEPKAVDAEPHPTGSPDTHIQGKTYRIKTKHLAAWRAEVERLTPRDLYASTVHEVMEGVRARVAEEHPEWLDQEQTRG